MDLLARYHSTLASLGMNPDPAQLRVIDSLARVGSELARVAQGPALPGWLGRLLPSAADGATVRGAYLWGGVGRGKTFLMDLFFDELPTDRKLRYHFHRIMNRVHARLAELRDERDPLAIVADGLARDARVICFDEFFVTDIADAMILGRLLDSLFIRGVTLIATSNTPPEQLYRGGLQRERFVPAIELLCRHTEVVHVDGLTDYRLRVLEAANVWHVPLDDRAESSLHDYFSRIAPGRGTSGQPMDIHGRPVLTRRRADGIGWFSFADLCEGPRGADDYIEVARVFQTVILSGVPMMDGTREDAARRFVALVDEFYDRRVKLIVSAAAPIGRIYAGSRLTREFERTRSRLLEMQSVEYLAAEHLA
jgi:cell division protein ZapE